MPQARCCVPARHCSLFCRSVLGTYLLPFPANEVQAAVPPSIVSMPLSSRAQDNVSCRYPPSRENWRVSCCLLSYLRRMASSACFQATLGWHRPGQTGEWADGQPDGRATGPTLSFDKVQIGLALYFVLRLRSKMLKSGWLHMFFDAIVGQTITVVQ